MTFSDNPAANRWLVLLVLALLCVLWRKDPWAGTYAERRR